MKITVRQASIHDLDALVPLFDAYRQFYRQRADLDCACDFLRARFAHHESVIFLADDEHGATLGFSQLYPLFSSVACMRKYLLNDLFVNPTARRGGVAKRLLGAAAQFARANGAASLSLSTALDNFPAQKLYESQGWRRDGRYIEYQLQLS